MTANNGSGWGRALLGRLGPLALGLVLALVAAEAVLRVGGSRLDGYYVWWPNLRKVFHPEPGVMAGVEGEKIFAINSLGLRGDEPSSDDTFRVLALGGSTTECLFLDQEEAWPQRLQTLGKIGFNHIDHDRVVAEIGIRDAGNANASDGSNKD